VICGGRRVTQLSGWRKLLTDQPSTADGGTRPPRRPPAPLGGRGRSGPACLGGLDGAVWRALELMVQDPEDDLRHKWAWSIDPSGLLRARIMALWNPWYLGSFQESVHRLRVRWARYMAPHLRHVHVGRPSGCDVAVIAGASWAWSGWPRRWHRKARDADAGGGRVRACGPTFTT